jgi:hypothetical protein
VHFRTEEKGQLRATACSADGRRIAIAESGTLVRVRDLESGQPLSPGLRHDGDEHPVLSLRLSQDGSRLLTVTAKEGAEVVGSLAQAVVRVWDVAGGKVLLRVKQGQLWGPRLSPDGCRLLLTEPRSFLEGAVELWDVAAGRKVPLEPSGNSHGPLRGFDFSPDSRLLAGVVQGFHLVPPPCVRVWSVQTGKQVFSPTLPDDEPVYFLFSLDSRQLHVRGLKKRGTWDTRRGTAGDIIKREEEDRLLVTGGWARFRADGLRTLRVGGLPPSWARPQMDLGEAWVEEASPRFGVPVSFPIIPSSAPMAAAWPCSTSTRAPGSGRCLPTCPRVCSCAAVTRCRTTPSLPGALGC